MTPQDTEAELRDIFETFGKVVWNSGWNSPSEKALEESISAVQAIIAAHDQEVALQTKVAIHDEYWHSQKYIARHGVGELH